MQREYTEVYPGSGKEDPTSSGGESVVFPYTEVLVYGLQAMREVCACML
jgi:hypothetical protein